MTSAFPVRRAAAATLLCAAVAAAAGSCAAAAPPRKPVAVTSSGGPSAAALLVCNANTQAQLSGALGEAPTTPVVPTWHDHRYSCVYAFPDGPLALSVQDVGSTAEATAWFDRLRVGGPGPTTRLSGIGQDAFQLPDGSVTVRKDGSVLTVDVHGLRPAFGHPVRTPAQTARLVATTVMLCWRLYGHPS